MLEAHFPVRPAHVVMPVTTTVYTGQPPTTIPPLEVNVGIGTLHFPNPLPVTGTVSVMHTAPQEVVLFNAVSSPGASASVEVGNYTHHSVQHIMTGTASVHTRTSLDGANWYVEHVATDSGLISFVGQFRYISANYVAGSGVVTTRLISG